MCKGLWDGTQPEVNQYFGSRHQEANGMGAGIEESPSAWGYRSRRWAWGTWQRLDCAGLQARLTGLDFILNINRGPCRL